MPSKKIEYDKPLLKEDPLDGVFEVTIEGEIIKDMWWKYSAYLKKPGHRFLQVKVGETDNGVEWIMSVAMVFETVIVGDKFDVKEGHHWQFDLIFKPKMIKGKGIPIHIFHILKMTHTKRPGNEEGGFLTPFKTF